MTARLSVFRLVLTSLFMMLAPIPVAAQVSFLRTYGGPQTEAAWSVLQLPDGGYVFGGQTASFGAGSDDFWLVCTDSLGETLWTRTYGGAGSDICWSVGQTSDGGYIMAGTTWSFGAGSQDAWLVKTDEHGDTTWTRTHGDTAFDRAVSVRQAYDGGYVLTGGTRSYGGFIDLWLVKTDASGNRVWFKNYGGPLSDGGSSVQQTTDSGYIVVGNTRSFGAGSSDAWLIKTDAAGDTVWTRTYGGADVDQGSSVQQTADGGYLIAGSTRSFGARGDDFWLIKTDAAGDTLWTRTYDYSDVDLCFSVQQTRDSGFFLAGYTNEVGGGYDVYLIRTDPRGETLWTRMYGGPMHDMVNSGRQTADGGYIIAGSTVTQGPGGQEAWLIKTDPAGTVGIAEPRQRFAPDLLPTATVCRGVLHLRPSPFPLPEGEGREDGAVLLAAMGRKVLDLAPGANNVRHLAPGVYFVREEGSRGASERVRKVVVSR